MSTPTTNNNKRRKMGANLKSLARDLCDAITADDDHPVSTFALGGVVHIKTPAVKTRRAPKEAQNASAQAHEEGNASDPILIRWDPPNEPTAALRKTSFPLTSDADEKGFEQLLEDTQPATFGRGGDEVLDETYRKAMKLPATAFMTSLNPYELGIIDTVRQVLLPSIETAEGSRLIRAELYNINIYSGPSGKFKAHVDTPRSSLQIGSLVVCLPMEHKGGELAVRQDGRSHTFDWGANSEKPLIQWAAFYSDSEHEVFEVKSGHRVTMTYNLYATPRSSSPARQLPAFSPASLPLYGKIKALVASKRFQRKDRIIGFYSTHAYPHTVGEKHRNLPLCLKGIDMAVYETFRSLGATVHLCSVIEHKDTGDGRTASDIETDGGKFSDGQADSAPSKKTAKAKKTRRRRSNNAPGHRLGQSSSRSRGADWESEEAESSEGDSEVEGWKEDIPSAKKHVKNIASICLSGDLDETIEVDDIIKDCLGDDTVDPKQIVWINKNNGLKELQIAYLTYGNEASMDEVYSHFAMVIEIPAGSIAA